MSEIDSLIEQIKCEFRENPFFSEGDLAALDACLPTSDQIEAETADEISQAISEDPCAQKTISAITKQLELTQDKVRDQNRANYVIGRLKELKYLLYPVELFYQVRLQFYNKYKARLDARFQTVTPTPERQKQINALTNVQYTDFLLANNPDFHNNTYGDIIKDIKTETGIDFQTADLWYRDLLASGNTASLRGITANDTNSVAFQYFYPKAEKEFLAYIEPISGAISARLINYNYKSLADSIDPVFTLNLPGRDLIPIPEKLTEKTGQVDADGNTTVLNKALIFKLNPTDTKYNTAEVLKPTSPKFLKVQNLPYIGLAASSPSYPYRGLLANFYKKIEDPLKLFTIAERGLTTDKLKVDKVLTKEKLDGIVKENRADGREETFYIENVQVFQDFYKDLDKKIDAKIEEESVKLKTSLYKDKKFSNLEKIAKLQVLELLQKGELVQSPTQTLTIDGKLIKPTKEATQINDIIEKSTQDLDKFIKLISTKIAQISAKFKVNPEDTKKALDKTGCVPQAEAPCKDLPKPGSDPLGYAGISAVQESVGPDYTCDCYWKEVTKHLNKVGLLPIPDIPRLPAFRYWPIGLLIPTPVPIHIPLPQIWTHLVTLNFPFGTLVVWYIQCGIVPSPIVLFIGPDGKKIILLGFRALQGQFDTVGYTIDESETGILGVSQNSIGKPKGTSVKTDSLGNIIPEAASQKALRIAAQAKAVGDLIAGGKLMPNGFNIPFKPGEKPKLKKGKKDTLNEITGDLEDFEIFVKNISRKVLTKIDELGDIEIPNFSIALTNAQAAAKNNQTALANSQLAAGTSYNFNTAWLNCDPNNLTNNISGHVPADFFNANNEILQDKRCKELVLALSIDLDKFLDKLKLGSYTIPKEKGKSINPQAMLDGVIESITEYLSSTNFGKAKTFNFNKRFRKAVKDLDLDAKLDAAETRIDLTKSKNITKFKKTLKDYTDDICDIFSGKTAVDRNSSSFKRKVSAEIAKRKRFNQKNSNFDKDYPKLSKNIQSYESSIGEKTPRALPTDEKIVSDWVYAAEVKKRKNLASILGQTITGLTKPIQSAVSDFSKVYKGKCCTAPLEIPQFIDPLMLGIILSFKQLMYKAIDAVTADILKKLFGEVFNVGRSTIQGVINLISKAIPSIDFPLNGASILKLLINTLKPVLPILRIPLPPAARTLGVPQLTLNLDAIVKPLLKNGINVLINEILKNLPIKICDLPITGVSSSILSAFYRGIKSSLKKAITSLIDTILSPLNSIFQLLKLIKGVKGAFTSLFDSANPFLKIYKLIKETIERAIPTAAFIKLANDSVLLAKMEILKGMDKASKNLPDAAVYIPISAGAALQLGNILRLAVHPILNQDDLPSWERLSLKNPLYVLFLDDLSNKAKASTGSILGQDIIGNPVYVPTP